MAEQVTVTKVIEIDVKPSAEANAHLQQIADSMKGIGDKSDSAAGSLKGMLSTLRGFVGFQIFDMIGDKVMAVAAAFQHASDQSRQLEERMKLVTTSTGGARDAFQTIVDISIRQGRELDGVAKLYERIQRNSENLAVSQKGVGMITEGVAASLRLAGAGAQEANAAMLQFSQAMASGRLGGDEFRSLMENDSVLMQALSKELGINMGQLREWSKDGKLSTTVLRDAFLKVGEDGKTMLQRLMEQAEKLPKTFDQAKEGAKTALVDLVNALQQTGDKAESIFTSIVRRLTASMREMAQTVRDEALIRQKIAEEIGKDIAPPEEKKSFEERRVDSLIARRKAINELVMPMAEMDLANAKKQQGGSMSFMEKLLSGEGVEEATTKIKALKGELKGIQELLEDTTRKNVSAANPTLGLTTGTPIQTVPPKTKKEETATDLIKRLRESMAEETTKLQEQVNGTSKVVADADAQIEHVMRLPMGKETAASLAAFKEWYRKSAEANEERKRMIQWIKDQKGFEEFVNTQIQAQEKRDATKLAEEVKKRVDAYNKEHLTKDPFEQSDIEAVFVDKLLANPDVAEKDKETLKKYVQYIREKAAKELLGEKDPLKDVAGQMADNWETAFGQMEDSLLDFSKSAKDIVGDLVVSILRDFAKIELKQELQPFMQMGKDFIKDTDWSKMFGSIGDMFGFAKGAVFPGGIRMFAQGDILDKPTGFMYGNGQRGIGGEAGTEAVMPLKRGNDGKLGVGATPVTVNVYNTAPNTRTRQEESTNSRGERQINIMVEEMVEAGIGSGRFDNVLNNSFAIARKGK